MAKKLAHDRVLFTTVVLLTGCGLAMVFSASAAAARDQGLPFNLFLVKQGVAALLGFAVMLTAMHVDYRNLARPAVVYLLLGGVILLLVLVLFGPQINGTRRWFLLGPLSLQPSELAKLALVPFIAYQVDRKPDDVNQMRLLLPSALGVGLLAGLVLLQPDLGTAFLLLATAVLMLFLAGLSWRYLVAGGLALAPLLWFLVVSEPYRRERLLAFLEPGADPLGTGWQARQSLIAIGSGGLFGLGPGESVQKLHFLPHPQSDFIFSIIAEELGLVGALGILVAFGVLLWRGVAAGHHAPDTFGSFLGWGFTGLLVLQAFIHVGVAVAMLPTKGIPLPFISYGGSSLVVALSAAGVLLNVSEHG